MLDLITLAVPVFFILIGLELAVTRLLERDYYRLSDSINDLSCGIVQQLLEIFTKTALFGAYIAVFTRVHVLEVPLASPAAWAACFLGVDFLYYWFHRLSHEINAFWAAHVVHHQSEEYNLSVALRQGAIQGWFSWVFYLPLAAVGFPPAMFLTCTSINTLYQFWIHTRVIGRMGPFEWLFNTPSHHRVHHGRNPRYIDRNHGGTLIVWDKLFGTFEPEGEEVVYGITTPLRSWNPVWANLQYWVELGGKARRTARWVDRVLLFLKPPGWHPADLGGFQPAPPVDADYRKWDFTVPRGVRGYAFVQFVVVLVAASALLYLEPTLDKAAAAVPALAALGSLVVCGALLEGRAWARTVESLRLTVVALGALALLGAGLVSAPVGALTLAFSGISLALLRRPPVPA